MASAKSAAKGAGPRCVLRGTTLVSKNLEIYNEAKAGKVIAKFTGGASALTLSEFPAAAHGRAKVVTGLGSGNFAIEGYSLAKRLPLHTKTVVPVVPGHIWIGKAQEVNFDGAQPNKIKALKHLTTPISQSFRGWTSCSNLSVEPRTPPGWEVDGEARGYRMKGDSIVLYDDPGRDRSEVTTLHRAAGAEMLFWSTKRRGAWVQVAYEGEILIEAWAKARDLKALPRGETMDLYKPPTRKSLPPKLKVAGEPQQIKTTREHYIRAEPKDDGEKLGKIEMNTETLVVDVVAGWASVLPKSLNVMPADGEQFWVKAEDLKLPTPPAKPSPAPAPTP